VITETRCAACGVPAPLEDAQGNALDDTDWIDMGWHVASDGRLLCPDCKARLTS
jgi:hypothetical protein